MANLVPIYNASGQAQQVPDYDLNYYQSQGWTQGTPPDPTQQKSTSQIAQELQAAGIDTTGLDETQIAWLGMMSDYQKLQASNDKNIAPPSYSPQDLERYMAQAAQELGPSYQQAMKMNAADLRNTIATTTGDAQYATQLHEQQATQAQKDLAKQMSDAGLTFSGIRKQSQDVLKSQEKGLVRSEASKVAQNLRDLASNYQRTYGTQALSELKIPGLSYAGVNVQPPSAPYKLAPGFGSAEQAQKVAEVNRGYEIAGANLGNEAAATQNVKPQPLASL